jgi:hypothetical protein
MIRDWVAAVAALDWADDHRDVKVNVRESIFLGKDSSREEQERLYKSLLELPWLAPSIRYAVMRELGLSKRDRDREVERGRCLTIYLQIEERKAYLKRNGTRLHGGIHATAIADIAEQLGVSAKGLEKRLERNGPTAAERRHLREQAKRNMTDKF